MLRGNLDLKWEARTECDIEEEEIFWFKWVFLDRKVQQRSIQLWEAWVFILFNVRDFFQVLNLLIKVTLFKFATDAISIIPRI